MQRNDDGAQDKCLTSHWLKGKFGFGVGQESDLGTDSLVGKGFSFTYAQMCIYYHIGQFNHSTEHSFNLRWTFFTFGFQLHLQSTYIHIFTSQEILPLPIQFAICLVVSSTY
jgi:hypothetical protein